MSVLSLGTEERGTHKTVHESIIWRFVWLPIFSAGRGLFSLLFGGREKMRLRVPLAIYQEKRPLLAGDSNKITRSLVQIFI